MSVEKTFVTPSNTPGDINVYFSQDIEPSVAVLDTALGNIPLEDIIVSRIDAAQFDVSVAIYTYNLPDITTALINAWNRGVKVRLILDTNVSQTQANVLRNAGVPVITHTFGGSHPSIHHNKFFVFDARDTTSQTDDWIWTGSFNMTTTSVTQSNNGVEIQDSGIAQAFLIEFNEMWGSDTDTPIAANSRFSTSKLDNTPHSFVVNGIPIELYFSPSDGTEQKIVDEVNDSQTSAYFMTLVFTSNPISNALEFKHNTVPGFQVRGVFDTGNSNQTGSEYPNMIGGGSNPWSPPADVHLDGDPYTLHDKVGIFDSDDWNSNPTVVTGSHNWSNAANTTNDENAIIIHDANITNQYLQSFTRRYHVAGGTGDFIIVSAGDRSVPSGVRFSSPFPNPSRTGGVIEWSLPGSVASGQRTTIRLYDMRGRLVRTLVDREAEPGTHRINFNGRDQNGQKLNSGVYFLRLDAVGENLSQKWVVLD